MLQFRLREMTQYMMLQFREEAPYQVHRAFSGPGVASDPRLHEHTTHATRLKDTGDNGVGLRPIQAERVPRSSSH